jgi:hypothetical protein
MLALLQRGRTIACFGRGTPPEKVTEVALRHAAPAAGIHPLDMHLLLHHLKGASEEDIARTWQISRTRVLRALKTASDALGIPPNDSDSDHRTDITPDEVARAAAAAFLDGRITGQELQIVLMRVFGATLRRIGDWHGVTRERVRRILVSVSSRLTQADDKKRIPWHRVLTGRCVLCGRASRDVGGKLVCSCCLGTEHTCKTCGAPFRPSPRGSRTYCPSCRVETRPCAWCGKPITRNRSKQAGMFRNKTWFCNRYCYGMWFGKTVGARPRPQLSCVTVYVYDGYWAMRIPGAAVAAIGAQAVSVTVLPDGAIRLAPDPEGRKLHRNPAKNSSALLRIPTRVSRNIGWLRRGLRLSWEPVPSGGILVKPPQVSDQTEEVPPPNGT